MVLMTPTVSDVTNKKGLLRNFLERGIQCAVEKVGTNLTESIKKLQMLMEFAPYMLNIKLKPYDLIP
jgi:hypothetical protein